IEGVVAAVDLRPSGNDDAKVTLKGATDDPDRKKHLQIVCGLRDRAGAEKVGVGQRVTIQGSFLYAPPFVLLSNAAVVTAGAVGVTQAEWERRLRDEAKTIEALKTLLQPQPGDFETNRFGKVAKIRLRGAAVTEEGRIKPDVLAELEKLTEIGELWLRNTGVSDEGLAFVKKLTKLDGLDLYDTKISDAGLAHLKEMR